MTQHMHLDHTVGCCTMSTLTVGQVQQCYMHWNLNYVTGSSDECHLWFQTLIENVGFSLMRLLKCVNTHADSNTQGALTHYVHAWTHTHTPTTELNSCLFSLEQSGSYLETSKHIFNQLWKKH